MIDHTGSDNLQVVNGRKLPISFSGCTIIPTKYKPLELSNLLRVPKVTQNLVYVSELCRSNNVSIKKFPWHYELKHMSMGKFCYEG